MQIIADLHLHSKYSRAVSPKMDLFEIASWASRKGITLAATADWTHPLWFRHLRAELKEHTDGLYTLKNPPVDQKNPVYFMLSVEISCIYSQGGLLRRVHHLLLAPSLETAEKINTELARRGAKLMSDGRPILGLSSKDLLELALAIDPRALLIPAHAWTPWFAIFGSKSGFNSIEECFGSLSKHIYAVETGLSSDPLMNWQIKDLDSRSILSFSDAHSAPKMAREATVFVPTTNSKPQTTNFSYDDIADAIKQKPDGKLKVGYTIEFFPEEGKYHYTGHRECGVRYSVAETKEKGIICPACKRPLTVGVEHRVLELSGHAYGEADAVYKTGKSGMTFVYDKHNASRAPFVSIIPLLEILTELYDGSPKKAQDTFAEITSTIGTEFELLLKSPLDTIARRFPRLAEGIRIVRAREADVDPGYDGVFGKVKIFSDETAKRQTPAAASRENQLGLF